MLTSTHEDYIELVYRGQQTHPEGVRITDLADELGCRMPTVTRTVQNLVEEGYIAHESRGLVRLTEKGGVMARDIAHRHDDVIAFLELILGLNREQAEIDACLLEHGLSPLAAERLDAFLNYVEKLPAHSRKSMREAVRRKSGSFKNLVDIKSHGWRR